MKLLVPFCFLLFFHPNFCAQNIVVLSGETKKPLEFVNLIGGQTQTILTTDKNGRVAIDSLKNDSVITIQLLGYQSIVHSYKSLSVRKQPVVLETSSFILNSVVISANRWEQKKNLSSHNISTIDKARIKLDAPQTAADLLSAGGDVFIQKSQQGGGSPLIRGFSTNRLLYSVDGVRMNTAIFRSGNLHNVISLDPLATERVEVLFGPGSILYGSDAIGGVMSFFTKNPNLAVDSLTINGNAIARFSSANSELTGHVDLAIQNKRWGALSSYTITDYGDLRIGRNGPSEYLRDSLVLRANNQDVVVKNEDNRLQIPTAYSQQNFMQKFIYKANEHLTIKYALHFSETSSFDRYDRLTEIENGQFSSAQWFYGPQVWLMNQLRLEYENKRKLFDKVKLNLAVQRFNESRNTRNFGDDLLRQREETVDAYSVNLDMYKKWGAKHQLFYGLEAVLNTVESIGQSRNIVTGESGVIQSRYPESNWYSSALYIKNQYAANENLSIDVGLRLNGFGLNSTFDTNFVSLPFNEISFNRLAVNASLGSVYKLDKSHLLRANFSTGYRSPNVDDIGKFFDSEPGSIVIPNSDLDPEYAYNFDVGFTSIYRDKLKIDASFFYTILDNALVRRNFQLNGSDSLFFDGENQRVQAIQNAANAFVFGFQFGLEWELIKSLSFTGQFNFQQGEEELDDGSTTPSRHAAPFFGIARLVFEKNKWKVQGSIQGSGSVRNNQLNIGEQAKVNLYAIDSEGNPYSPSWYTLNIKSQYQLNKTIDILVGIENITNQLYRTYSSGIAAAGRNLSLSAHIHF